jgi:uncharacterized delta-60 repeat protein
MTIQDDERPFVIDPSFQPALEGYVSALAVQTDGKIILAGDLRLPGNSTNRALVRLNPDGTDDDTFRDWPGGAGSITGLLLQPDGQILVPDSHLTPDHVWAMAISRLKANGEIDPTFESLEIQGGSVNSMARQADGKLLLIGDFTQLDNKERRGIARLNTDGSLDLSFDPGAGSFGVWVYTDQLTQRYDTGGTASNGDYAYSEDGPNAPANIHRFKAYPLKNAAGVTVAGSYLLAVEEAGNGDYQDYVFVLSNVAVAP